MMINSMLLLVFTSHSLEETSDLTTLPTKVPDDTIKTVLIIIISLGCLLALLLVIAFLVHLRTYNERDDSNYRMMDDGMEDVVINSE